MMRRLGRSAAVFAVAIVLLLGISAVAFASGQPDKDSKAKVSLTVVMTNNVESFLPGEDENNNEIIRRLREGSGYDLKWIILPADQPWNKLTLMISSGETPDVVYCPPKNVFADYLHKGALAPIDEYVKNAPNLQKLVPEATWAAVTWKGKRYAVPIPQNQNIAGNASFFVRKDWFAELGIKDLVTVDDYYQAMKTILDKKKVIPLTQTPDNGVVGGFSGAFGIGTTYKEKDGGIVASYIQPEAKEYLQYMNKLYAEGLLDKEYPINKGANVQEKLVAGKAAMNVTAWSSALSINNNFKAKNPTGELAYIAPPKGPRGETGFSRYGPVRSYLFVPAQSKHIKEAVGFLDYMSRPEVYTYVSFGEEGKQFNRKGDDIFLTDAYQKFRFQMYYVLVDTQMGFAVRLRDKGFKVFSDQVVPYATLEPIAEYAPPMPEVLGVSADLDNVTLEYFVRFITGDLGLDKFNEYVTAWKAKGGDKAVAALDSWYKSDFKKK